MDYEFSDPREQIKLQWRRHRWRLFLIIILAIAVGLAVNSCYVVQANSQGVVLRLGKIHTTSQPGLHFKFPWPIDRAMTVPVAKVQSLEFGYQTIRPGRRTAYAPTSDEHLTMARMLTGDLNLAHVEWVVQYRIVKPEDYLFKIGGDPGDPPHENARDLIRDAAETAMRRIIGDVSVDTVITTGREQIADEAELEIQGMLDDFEAGIVVVGVKMQSATPPEPVKDAFDAVNRAKQVKERVVNEAKGERNRLIPAARGKRDRVISEAEGFAIRAQKAAEGEANAFLAKLAEYEKAPDVTRRRLYVETMEQVLLSVPNVVIIDESLESTLPLLHLDGRGETATVSTPASKGGGR